MRPSSQIDRYSYILMVIRGEDDDMDLVWTGVGISKNSGKMTLERSSEARVGFSQGRRGRGIFQPRQPATSGKNLSGLRG